MIFYGKNITDAAERLEKLPVEQFYHAIRNPKPESVALIRQLRVVQQIDKQQYAQLKKRLPYIVCGCFTPPFRRGENFASISRFVLDFDHLTSKQIDLRTLRDQLESDPHVELMFLSPGGDGLKIMIRLSEPCKDKGLFAIFYKAFLYQFAQHYRLEQVADSRTCDVTRACFFSHDPDAYYNSQAVSVRLEDYVDTSSTLSIFEQPSIPQDTAPQQEAKTPLPDSTIENIKEILSLSSTRKKPSKNIYVPEQLNDIIETLQQYIQATGAIVRRIDNIQYGKKIQTAIGNKLAETNLFYGKRGFSVVISPHTGTDDETNYLMAELIQSFLDTQIL